MQSFPPDNEYLQGLLNSLPFAVYTTDSEGVLTFYNKAAADLWGRKPVIGTDKWCGSWRIYNPDGTNLPHEQCPMAIALKEKRAVHGAEAIAERPDGTRFPFRPYPSPLYDSDGHLIGAVNVLIDITDEKKNIAVLNEALNERGRVEEELAHHNREMIDLLNKAPIGMHWVGPGNDILWANQAELDMLGYSAEEYIGQDISKFHADKPVIDDMLNRLKCGEELRNYKALLKCKDGTLKHVLISSNVRWEGGEFAHTRCFTIDNAAQIEANLTQARLAAIVQSSDDAIISKDFNGYITSWNPAAERIFGYTEEEVVGCHISLIIPDDRLGEEDEIISKIRSGQRIEHYETKRRTKAGDIIDISLSVSPVRSPDGAVVGASKIARDITEYKRVQSRLELQIAALERLHELSEFLSSAPDLKTSLQMILDTLVALHGAQFGMLSLFDSSSGRLNVVAHTGFDRETIASIDNFEPLPDVGACGVAFNTKRRKVIVDIEADPCFAGLREFARSVGFRSVHSTPISRRDGVVIGVVSVQFSEPREPTVLEISVADMCARYAANVIQADRNQRALRESERLYRAIGESIDYGIWVCDTEGKNIYASESFLKLVGLTQEQCSEFGWSHVIHPDEAETTIAEWKDCVRTGRVWDKEHRFRGVDGRWHPILARGVPVRGDNGNITSWAGINLDISRLKESETLLKEADRRKDEFLATLAHELRNPLAPLQNALHILRSKTAGVSAARAQEIMERQLEQMVRLVDDLMDVSRITRGKIELQREPVDLAAVISNAVEIAGPLIAQLNHTLTVNSKSRHVWVRGDSIRLGQVFSNLLNNAAKYTPGDGKITVDIEQERDMVNIHVRDTGIGMSPDVLGRVFDMFSQANSSFEQFQGGLGIGLSLARKLTEMHGGSVTAASDGPGKGSTFTVRLPTWESPKKVKEDFCEAQCQQPATDVKRVLVVDDNEDSAQTLGLSLELEGHNVRLAYGARDALKLANEFLPDVILLDIGLPEMNGFNVCKILRENPELKDAIIIAQTGWGQEEHRRLSREAGFNHHLVKPVDINVLQTLLSQ